MLNFDEALIDYKLANKKLLYLFKAKNNQISPGLYQLAEKKYLL